MRIPRMMACFCLFSLVCSLGIPSVGATAQAKVEGKYKNFYSDGWFGTYALKEFDKIAPAPGVNWFVDDAQDWLPRAQRDGWVVKNKPAEAVNGAIIIGYNEGLAWVGVAREVTDQGLIFETVMGGDGKPARYWMRFSEIGTLIHFKGSILPKRIPSVKTVSPMKDYKGVRGFAGAAWPVQEFDRVAPKPGFNWQGPEKEWSREADRKGWKVEKKPTAIKPGSLIVFAHQGSGQIKIAFVRNVFKPTVVFEFVDPPFSRVITARLTTEQLLDKNAFGGFVFDSVILPERKGK